MLNASKGLRLLRAFGFMDDSKLPTETVEADAPINSEPEVIDNGDDTSTITLDGNDPSEPAAFLSNLAESLPDSVLDTLAGKYLDLIEQDTEARKPRDKQYAEGLKKTGIAEPAPGGANFEGASRATHPVLAEAYVDFASSAIKELFPPNGPVRTKIEGKPNRNKTDKATRKAAFMNWQLTSEIKGYRSELEKLLTQLPAGGTQFAKVYWSDSKKRIEAEFVPIDDFILPYNAKNFYDAQRKFHKMDLSPLDLQRSTDSGEYRDWSLPNASGANYTKTESSKQTDKIEGVHDDYSSDDVDRPVYQGVIYDEIDGDDFGRAVPYLVTIDSESRKVLALYRNWSEDDDTFQEIDHLVDYNFIPWRGALAIGLPQLIGGLSDALTGALRALLDSALIANSATAIKLKGLPSGNNNSIEITQATEIDSMGQDDIRKIAMPLPFPGPSPVLFQLLGFLVGAAKGVVSTAEEKIADASNNMPVGTALALIEQGAKVFSAIHARLHDSQRRVLEIIHRLNRDHLPDRVQFGTDPEDYVTRSDFEGPLDVRPVSDPNIFSESQRFAQTQAIIQMLTQLTPIAAQVPATGIQLHALIKRSLEQMKYPDIEEILPDLPAAAPLNPVDENVDLALGKPVKAYEGQDHQAHIQVHADFAQSPYFGTSPAMAPTFMTNMLNHIQDHLLIFYQELMKQDAGSSIGSQKIDDNPQAAEALAKSSAVVGKAMGLAFEKIPTLMQQAVQHIQANAPKPPQDPMIQIEAQKAQGQQQIAQGKLSLEAQKHKDEMQIKTQDMQAQLTKLQGDLQAMVQGQQLDAQTSIQTTDMKARADLEKNAADNQTAEKIALMNIASDHAAHLIDGTSMGAGPKAGV